MNPNLCAIISPTGEKCGLGPLANNEISVVTEANADGYWREVDEYEGYREKGNARAEEEYWEQMHEVITNFTLFLICIHLLGVFVTSWLHGENLVRAMITGTKRS